MQSYFRWIQFVLWAMPVLLFGFLFSRYFVFSGTLDFSYDLQGKSPYVSVVPESRISEIRFDEAGSYRNILAEPVYFDVRVPQAFRTGEVTITFRASVQESIELGGVAQAKTQSILFIPLYNKQLEELRWPMLRQDGSGVVLWQRAVEYTTVADFLSNIPPKEEVVTYRHDLGDGYDPFSPLVDLTESEKNYIIAHYPKNTSSRQGYQHKTVSFDMTQLEYGYHKYRFVLSAPGVLAEQDMRLSSLHFHFEREPIIWKNFWQMGKRYLKNRI